MRFPRLTHRVALGLGAIGLVLASGCAATAVVSAIQPAGALSAQVPAVGVREQNVNSAGRIRVALPKGSLGVSGSVSVSNLPENSAGRVKVQNGSVPETSHMAQGGVGNLAPGGAPQTILYVSGPGVLKGAILSDFTGGAYCYQIYTDGNEVAGGDTGSAGYLSGFAHNGFYRSVYDPQAHGLTTPVTGWSTEFTPPGGLPFAHSLKVAVEGCSYSSSDQGGWYGIWYTTAS